MRKVLLDTNAFTSLFKGDERVLETISKSDTIYVSIFVLGELLAGFKGGSKELQNKEILNRFLEKNTVEILEATAETADVFGQLKHELRIAGTPIPINDVWIASHALETGSVLITYDIHFKKVKGIRLWDYINVQE
jgi:tRNA(fMet)-specific endonuclease VapC